MADRLAIIGSSGHAKVVLEAARARNPETEFILLDDDPGARERSILGVRVAGGRDLLDRMPGIPVALGIGDNRARALIMAWLGERGHPLATVVHPRAFVAPSVDVGAGAFFGAGAIAIADANIGDGAIINTGASIDHDCNIGQSAHIAPGCRLCGNVAVGDGALLGVGTVVRPGIRIAAGAVIGAGAVVVRDITEPGTYIGNPARRA